MLDRLQDNMATSPWVWLKICMVQPPKRMLTWMVFFVHVLYGDYGDTTVLNYIIDRSKYWYYRDTTKQKTVLWCTMVHCYSVSEPQPENTIPSYHISETNPSTGFFLLCFLPYGQRMLMLKCITRANTGGVEFQHYQHWWTIVHSRSCNHKPATVVMLKRTA